MGENEEQILWGTWSEDWKISPFSPLAPPPSLDFLYLSLESLNHLPISHGQTLLSSQSPSTRNPSLPPINPSLASSYRQQVDMLYRGR